MLSIFLSILIWLGAIIILFAFVFVLLLVFGGLGSRNPFGQVPRSILRDIESIALIDSKSNVYNIGSGDGRVLFYLSRKIPTAKYFGIENNPGFLIFSKVKSFFINKFLKRKISIDYSSFDQIDLSTATHIITYLYPETMDTMLTRFENNLKPGTKLISISFKFTLREPKKKFNLGRGKYKLARKIYLYEF